MLIEGTDSSGKKTQSIKLVDRLNAEGIPTERLRIPNYDTPAGQIVGQCYLGKDLGLGELATEIFGDPVEVDPKFASLLYAMDRSYSAPYVREVLASGTNLVLDRWTESNMGHQGAKIEDPHLREEMFDWISRLEYGFLNLPYPDLRIFLHMPTDVALVLNARRSDETGIAQDGHERNPNHLRAAEESYLHMLDYSSGGWHIVECAPNGTIGSLKTPEEISEEVYSIVEKAL